MQCVKPYQNCSCETNDCNIQYVHLLTHKHTHHTHNRFTAILDFLWHYTVEPAPEETFTQSHLPWSSVIIYLLPPCTNILDSQKPKLTVICKNSSYVCAQCTNVIYSTSQNSSNNLPSSSRQLLCSGNRHCLLELKTLLFNRVSGNNPTRSSMSYQLSHEVQLS